MLQATAIISVVILGGEMASVIDTGPKVHGFIPGRGQCIFKGDKNPQHPFFRKESKAGCPIVAVHLSILGYIHIVVKLIAVGIFPLAIFLMFVYRKPA
jgi:hypothetical protein